MVEYFLGKEEVTGSIPVASSRERLDCFGLSTFFLCGKVFKLETMRFFDDTYNAINGSDNKIKGISLI